ncbi:hypothetical protein E4U17_007827 [Claviceps sp. LM77 group G4]|nr:hypothetical protein E4U17_007827 [Claviceps sp. LM77 group G4]
MERMCKSILTYTLCGHTKEFDRPCRENFGSNRRRCSAANRHTTRQTNDKWPCEVCRLYPRSRRRLKRKRADDDSPNVTPNGMSTLQGYINKIAHVKSVDKPTRQDGSDLIRHRLPIGSSFLERTETLKNHWFNYDTKDDINKDQQVKSVDDPTRQQRVAIATVAIATVAIATVAIATVAIATDAIATDAIATDAIATDDIATDDIATDDIATTDAIARTSKRWLRPSATNASQQRSLFCTTRRPGSLDHSHKTLQRQSDDNG